jgi:hypothetical protein
VAQIGDRRGFWSGDLRERGHLEDLGVDGKIISKWNFKKCDGEARSGFL